MCFWYCGALVAPGPGSEPWAPKLAWAPGPGPVPAPILVPEAKAPTLDPPKAKSIINKQFTNKSSIY